MTMEEVQFKYSPNVRGIGVLKKQNGVCQCCEKAGSLSGYLFQCLHCQKHHLWADAD